MAGVDGSGRGSREAHWRGVIKSCESSGLTIAGYCREQGISVSKYHWWKSALKRRAGELVVAPTFAEVLTSEPVGGALLCAEKGCDAAPAARGGSCGAPPLIELSLGDACRIGVRPGFDGETLLRVIALMERPAC